MRDFPCNKWLGERLRLFLLAVLTESRAGRKVYGEERGNASYNLLYKVWLRQNAMPDK
jgi:hypothetical protein